METSAHILMSDDAVQITFDWNAFDGDDCFQNFFITVRSGAGAERFDFGPCVV